MEFKTSPLNKLDLSSFGINNEVYIKRDDLIHPIVSGNKWRKLKHNISYVKSSNFKGVISQGGAYSSHIQALSYVCYLKGIKCVLIIRGEEPKEKNDILNQCLKYGAKLHFCSRANYSKNEWINDFKNENHPSFFLIPEGGANEYGIKGCRNIIDEIKIGFDEIYCEVGSGATLAGISSALNKNQHVNGVVVLKGAKKMNIDIRNKYLKAFNNPISSNWSLLHDYHFGGYAKHNEMLISFMKDFYNKSQIKTDPIYSGKMFFALIDQLLKNPEKRNKRVIALHSGGLSGIPGYEKRYGIKIFN